MNSFKKFVRNTSGNFAISLALVFVPIVSAAGLAYDYSSLSNIKSKAQNAADSAALAAARETDLSETEKRRLAKDVFLSNYLDAERSDVRVRFENEKIVVKYRKSVNTTFMGLVGKSKVEVDVEAAANLSNLDVELALVLDISGSMNATLTGGTSRIAELKTAAHNLLDQLNTAVGSNAKVSIVPFTMNVNVGKHRTSMVIGENHDLFDGTEWKGCVQELAAPQHIANKPTSRPHAYIWPPAPNDTSVGICKNPGDGTNLGYATLSEVGVTGYSAQYDGPNRNCVRHEILPLTQNISDAKTHIDSLTAEGNDGTIIAPGVTWGLRALSPEWPFKEGNTWSSGTLKYMVVLTDGEQTTEIEYQPQTCDQAANTSEEYKFNPSSFKMKGKVLKVNGPVDNWTPYGFIADSDPFSSGVTGIADLSDELSNLSLAACWEAKKDFGGSRIEIFTIGVSNATAPGTRVYDLLNKCASKPENHFFAEDADALAAAFKSITDKVSDLRLTH